MCLFLWAKGPLRTAAEDRTQVKHSDEELNLRHLHFLAFGLLELELHGSQERRPEEALGSFFFLRSLRFLLAPEAQLRQPALSTAETGAPSRIRSSILSILASSSLYCFSKITSTSCSTISGTGASRSSTGTGTNRHEGLDNILHGVPLAAPLRCLRRTA